MGDELSEPEGNRIHRGNSFLTDSQLYHIGIKNSETTQQSYFLFNYVSERTVSCGLSAFPCLRRPRPHGRFCRPVGIRSVRSRFEAELEVRNIFGGGNLKFQENDANRIEINIHDRETVFNFSLVAQF